MKIQRSRKHPGLRVLPEKREPGIALVAVGQDLAGSLAPGDRVLAVDGNAIDDLLDFHYYSALEAEPVLTVLSSAGEKRRVAVSGESLGGGQLEFEPLVFRTCGNDCVFCFIHQMPEGLREDLYFMDEDYRLGFLYGNYVTLALAREHELRRIVEQRLSPVYLSVHSTDMALRNRLLGLKKSRDIHELIRRLLDGGIAIHSQIVLLPGWNDGKELDRTLRELAAYHPGMESVGVVPVGLTDHRSKLTPLDGFDASGCEEVVAQVESWQERFRSELGARFVHLADEFYLSAARPLPAREDYEGFPLADNGIGMSRDFVDEVLAEAREWSAPGRPLRVSVVTGRLGERLFREYLLPELAGLPGLDLHVLGLDNRLFGSRVTVSGLLPGREILAGVAALPADRDLVLVPPNTLNAQELFLDDLSLDEMRSESPLPLLVPSTGLLASLRDFESSLS